MFAIRHPVETVLTLTDSAVDGMRPAEAVDLVTLQLSHARRLLASCGRRVLVVRLEELVTEPEIVLQGLAEAMGLPFEAGWATTAATMLPSDIRLAPAWNHDHVRMHRRELSDLANAWGY